MGRKSSGSRKIDCTLTVPFSDVIDDDTSTDVEKRVPQGLVGTWQRKHLHLGGEDSALPAITQPSLETPPHTWRRGDLCLLLVAKIRNTFTYVEKTLSNASGALTGTETPPRAWRRQVAARRPSSQPGNTSTCVEKQSPHSAVVTRQQKHLHERGEDPTKSIIRWIQMETPPRAWRRPVERGAAYLRLGNTSTGVEKTPCR